MDFDEKPIIYIVTTNENAYSRIADAARAIGYDVHFPLVDGCVDLFTIETDLIFFLIPQM